MLTIHHDARQYANGLKALLPTGAAWDWSVGSFGDDLVLATAQELVRVDEGAQQVLDEAIELHRPAQSTITLADYQRIADNATQTIPRKPLSIGHRMGYRVWSNHAPVSTPTPSVSVLSHLIRPATIGSRIGALLRPMECRYFLRVDFDRSVIDHDVLLNALMLAKQAHVYLYVKDVADMRV